MRFETQNADFLRIMRLKRNYLILMKKVCTFPGTRIIQTYPKLGYETFLTLKKNHPTEYAD